MNIAIGRVLEATPEIRALIEELNETLAAAYEPHQRHGLALDALFQAPVRFFLARLDGRPAGCGGVALLEDCGEVKRMFTRPAMRGRGVAKAMLQQLEAEARAAGKPMLRLETGIHQPEAVGLYRSVGFLPCGAFGAYARMPARDIELSLFFEKPLSR